MSKYQQLSSGIILVLVLSGTVLGETDVAAGKEKAGMCFNCHGAGGNSQNANFPSLAGQKPAYLVNQLRSFREGQRKGAMMENMAANLSDEDINNLAAYFGSLENNSAGGDSKLAKIGATKVAMCFGCHGQGAKGMGVTPRLAGQQPDYLYKQLKAFKEGTRQSGPMRGIANMLTDEDMRAVAAYMGSLK